MFGLADTSTNPATAWRCPALAYMNPGTLIHSDCQAAYNSPSVALFVIIIIIIFASHGTVNYSCSL